MLSIHEIRNRGNVFISSWFRQHTNKPLQTNGPIQTNEYGLVPMIVQVSLVLVMGEGRSLPSI
jgi:hypothetical protein